MAQTTVTVNPGMIERYKNKKKGPTRGKERKEPRPPGQNLRGRRGDWPSNRIGSQGAIPNDWYGQRQWPGERGEQKDKRSTPTKELVQRRLKLKKKNALES